MRNYDADVDVKTLKGYDPWADPWFWAILGLTVLAGVGLGVILINVQP